jgi:hypothetical protein
MNNNFRKLSAGVLVVGFMIFGAALLAPRPVEAIPAEITANVPAATDSILTKIKNAILNALKYSMTNAVLTASDTAAQRIAANAATYLVSGGNGKSPLAYITGWNNWHDNILADSVSDSINTLSTKYLGFGICAPLNLSLDLRIKLGVARLYAPKPSCTAAQAYSAYQQTKSNIQSGQFLSGMKVNFEMGTSGLSVALNTQYAIVNQALNSTAAQEKQRSTSPFKPLTDKISGNIKTPANMIEDVAKTPQNEQQKADALKKQVAINNMDLWAAVGTNALKIFTSTLMSKAIDKYLKGGVLTGKDLLCASSEGQSFNLCKGIVNETASAGTASGSTDAALASAYFAALFTPPVNQIDDYSPLGDLSSCPSAEARGIWNCVMDQGFVSALSAQDDGYLSVADAIKKPGMLNGNWELIPPNDTRNTDPNCYTKGFCYSNLVKLRRMRIIPVGWELAAEAAENDSSPITLQGAINAFNDKSSKYYHLVDPDWILKLPVTQCKAQVYGQTLAAANAGERAEVCVDAPSCVSEDGNGNCTGGYGYCTREHSVWQIDATSCPVQYASCDTFTDPKGKSLSVLKNTVDYGQCNVTNAGCRPYVAVGDTSGNFANGQPSVYLNSQAPDCDASAAGCRALNSVKSASTANLIPNPSLETTTADGSNVASWENVGGQYIRDGVNSYDGIASVHLVAGSLLQLGGYYPNFSTQPANYADVQVQPQTLYTLSFYARGGAGGTGDVLVKAFDSPFYGSVHACPDGSSVQTCLQNMTGDIGYAPTCTTTATTGTISCVVTSAFDYGHSVNASAYDTVFPLAAGYERQTLTFATSSNTHYLGFTFGKGDFYLDAIQLEKGPTATAFHVGGADNDGLNVDLLVPPAYLGCTGETTDPAACASYAKVCRQSEVGCDAFTPASGGTAVTAVTSSNDACPDQCVGYSTFKQEPTRWNNMQFPLYFIPSTAKSCDMTQVGCDEFTDLAASANGGESKAYYTYIRSCRQPDAASDGNYFTWEGSDASGYQLQSYVLVNKLSADNTMDNAAGGIVNVPKSAATASERGPVYLAGTNPAGCTQDIYLGTNGAAKNPDCREFIDADGDIFYRLLSATITATTDCKTYRKTLSTQGECAGSGGLWDDGSKTCDYYTLPSESVTCPASVNGCRAFTGNQGNNVQTLFTSDFENGNLDSWSNGMLSSESTSVGQHSYTITNGTASRSLVDAFSAGNSIMHQGRSYTLVVWAKGTGKLNAYLNAKNLTADQATKRSNYFADAANANASIQLSSEWQRYELGPVIAAWAPDATDTLALGAASGSIYFDNVELDETQDQFALVAGSWKTPAVCDQTSAGQALPQAQLNCSQYASQAGGAQVDLKSFDHLCRASAIGCEAFTDTQGTATPFASFKNAVCTLTNAVDLTNSRDCLFDNQTVCSVAPGDTSCRFSFDGGANQPGVAGIYKTSVAADTFVVPPDATDYLVNDGNHSCDAASVGCTALGDNDLNTLDASSHRVPWKVNGKTVYKIINPDNLSAQLCAQDTVSCTEWTSPSGDKSYFKDPGDALCEYKDKTTYNNNTVSGWFKKGTSVPCDPNFVIGGTSMGIWKNLDSKFGPDNFAGVCPTEQSSCTEFTDHADPGKVILPTAVGASCQFQSSAAASACHSTWCLVDAAGAPTSTPCTVEFPSGRPFYYINDSKITDATAACSDQGGLQVSQKKGCLLLNQTDNPQKNYDTVATYAASEAAGFALVAPKSNPGDATVTPAVPSTNDANIILKVTRDRVCSEWLECNTEQTVTDPTTGRDSTRCLSVGSCLQKGADGRCLTWGQLDTGTPTILNADYYSKRNVTSAGNDFSGFSIPDQMPVTTFAQTDSSPPVLTTNGTPATVSQTCKAYPEADAPFPKSVLVDNSGPTSGSRISGYNGANVCEDGNCECSYRKAVYGTVGNRYFSTGAETGTKADGEKGEIPDAICSGGKYDGQKCNPLATGDRDDSSGAPNLSCNSGQSTGECTAFTKVDSLMGQKGYCLEHDKALRVNGSAADPACITWLPVDSVQGQDTANQFLTAAFVPKINQERYCSAPAKYCVPHDCVSMPTDTPFCTDLITNTPVTFASSADYSSDPNITKTISGDWQLNYGCFQGCPASGGSLDSACKNALNTTCIPKFNAYCSPYLPVSNPASDNDYCMGLIQKDPACPKPTTAPASTSTTPFASTYCNDLYNACNDSYTVRHNFCSNLESNYYTSDYGNSTPTFTEVGVYCGVFMPGSTDYTWHGSSPAGGLPFNWIPPYNFNSGANGYKPASYYAAKPATASVTGPQSGFTLADCAANSNDLCNSTSNCLNGLECAAMNDLSVHQTEYTKGESAESYGGWATGAFTSYLDYKTIPDLGSHTAFGSVTNSTFPILSSSALRFSVKEASGDWVAVYNANLANAQNPDATLQTEQAQNAQNVSSETNLQSQNIGSYPLDFVGLYYFGLPGSETQGSASVTYNLTNPSLLLASQIDRVTVKVLSNGQDGLCQYNTAAAGAAFSQGDMYGVCSKSLFGRTGNGVSGWYGYNPWYPGNTVPSDDHNYTVNGYASYVVLNSANNWTSQLSAHEGSTTLTLLFSDDNPKRVIGIKVDLMDTNEGGYIYIAGLDAHMVGPICGLATYIGSSNPFADPFTPVTLINNDFAPVTFTNSVNAKKDYFPGGRRPAATPTAKITNQCTPWGAFTTTAPPSYVNAQTVGNVGACQLNQGTLYASESALKVLFPKGLSRQFSDQDETFDVGAAQAYAPALNTPPIPTINNVSINNVKSSATAFVFGAGSVRAALKFFARADNDHMPIRTVKINWGDGSTWVDSGNINFYKNHIAPPPDDAGCTGTGGFGTISPEACTEDPFVFTHVYSCAHPVSLAGSRAETVANAAGAQTGCIYTPSITIIDNWNSSGYSDATTPQVVVSP